MPAKMSKIKSLWGLSTQSLLVRHLLVTSKATGRSARVHVDMSKKAAAPMRVVESENSVEIFLAPLSVKEIEHDPRLKTGSAIRVRDAVGASLNQLEKLEVGAVKFDLHLDAAHLDAALLGLELALYRYKRIMQKEPAKFSISLANRGKTLNSRDLNRALAVGTAVNVARHLTNLPPNLLNPVTYATAVAALFAKMKNVRVEVWDEKRLVREKMNLHMAVGQASDRAPRLVHICYRGAKKPPVAFVGKGITFDSGGLDIKPSSGMRIMKKDMGGSAALVGLAYWAASQQIKSSVDFYLPLAENAIGSRSFRPGDIFTARSGQTVEIHNTDAEGRLVLADAIDVAVTQKQKPRAVIDIATLTGAIKVALGANLAGLFTNDSKLAQGLAAAGVQAGDLSWIMPTFERYRAQLNSPFADQVNSADGFGGAITAALFLEKFARDIPWAHLDIYAWKDAAEGAWLESGGSGQGVLALIQWLRAYP